MRLAQRSLEVSLLGVALIVSSVRVFAAESGVTYGAFVDGYYAYDFNRPATIDRSYTTQAARHNEFNLNLAHLEARLARDSVRGRLALQAGTSVQSNTAGEPTVGSVSGPALSRHLQEAVAGFRPAPEAVPGLWIDAGTYFSHVGLETWISADNMTYTRSLVAEYSPYYQSGVRVSWQMDPHWSTQIHLLNGWQNVSENNSAKTLGFQLAYAPNAEFSISYSGLYGRETSFRQFHDLVIKKTLSAAHQVAFQIDLGRQVNTWGGFALIERWQASEKNALALRLEGFSDPNGIVTPTVAGRGLKAWGASIGLDHRLSAEVLLRTEIKSLRSVAGAVFPGETGNRDGDTVWTQSLSVRF